MTASFILAALLFQDEVKLRGDEKVEGHIQYGEKSLTIAGRKIAYSQIREISECPGGDEQQSREELATREEKAESVDQFLDLADWCVGRCLAEEARRLREEVVERDPDNARARASLAYIWYENAWNHADDLIAGLQSRDSENLLTTAEWFGRVGLLDREARLAAWILIRDPGNRRALDRYREALVRSYVPSRYYYMPLGGRWWVFRDLCGHHRPHAGSNFALDFVKVDNDGRGWGETWNRNEDYFGWDAPVYAVSNGVVEQAVGDHPDLSPMNTVGETERANRIVLDHEDGTKSCYLHFRQGSLTVRPGDRVEAGQVIGRVGNSGNRSYPHLHFAVYDRFVDGEDWSYLSVPFAAFGFDVVALIDRLPSERTVSLSIGCSQAQVQEGWVVEAPIR